MAKRLVAESLFELYGPGYVSDIASSNAKEKDDHEIFDRQFPENTEDEIPSQPEPIPSQPEPINVFEQPYASGEGKPHGYKTYALLKALEDSGGMRRSDMQKFLWQFSYGKESLQREIFMGNKSSMRGHWSVAMSTGVTANYITKNSFGKWVLSGEGKERLAQLEKKFKDVK